MKIILFVLFCLLLKPSSAANSDIYSLRKLYYEAAGKKDSAKKFLQVMENLDVKTNPLLLCYKVMARKRLIEEMGISCDLLPASKFIYRAEL